MMEDYQEMEEERTVPEELLEDIIRKISRKNLMSFGRYLGLHHTDLDEIKFNNKEEGLYEIRHGLQRKFLEKFGPQATIERVNSALKKIGRQDLVKSIKSYGNDPADMKTNLNKTRFKECLRDLRDYMIKSYLDLEIPREAVIGNQPFILHENYKELTLILLDKFGTRKYDGFLPIKDIFKKVEEKIPKIILIESDPGFGKTTLSLKLASDWAYQEGYIRSKFDLVFHSNLKNFTGNFENILLNQISEIEYIAEKEKLETIKMAGERVLLILDDFHELDSSFKQKLQLHNLFKSMTVIITSITDEIEIQNKYSRRIPDMSMKYIWDKRIQIKGVTQEIHPVNHDIYDKNNTEQPYEIWLSYMRENINSPLFILLALVIRNTNPSSITEFFSRFISCLVKRVLVKNKVVVNVSTEIDILKPDDVNASYYRLLFQFGRLALIKLSKNETSFSREEIMLYCNDDEDLFRVGFLRRIVHYENYRLKIRYETFHRSFLDFFASFYIVTALKDEAELLFIHALLSEGKLLKNPDSLSQLLIVGLAKDNAHVILEHIFSLPSVKPFGISRCIKIIREMDKTLKNICCFLISPEIACLFLILIILITSFFRDDFVLFYFMIFLCFIVYLK